MTRLYCFVKQCTNVYIAGGSNVATVFERKCKQIYVYCKMCCHSGVLLVIFKSGNCIMNNTERTVVKKVFTYRINKCLYSDVSCF